MFNCFKKYLLIVAFLGAPVAYAMENNNNINAALAEIITKRTRFDRIEEEDVQTIKEYIAKGANPNYKKNGELPLICMAVQNLNVDLVKHLIQHNANINSSDNDGPIFNPLMAAVDKPRDERGFEIIKELCNAGASLILRDYASKGKLTIFHYLKGHATPKKAIETIITHARFYDQAADEQLRKTVKTALLVLNRLQLPQDIQFCILSKNLILDFSSGFNERFRKKLIEKNCTDFIFPYMEKRVENIGKTLQCTVDQYRKSAAECWVDENRQMHNNNAKYVAEIQSLLNGSKLREDMRVFKNSFSNMEQIPKDNLILAICDVQQLLEK